MHVFTPRWILSAAPCPGFCLFPTLSLSSPPGEITKPSLRDGPAANPQETFWDPELPSNMGPVLLSPTRPPARAFILGVRTPLSASPGSLPQLHVAAAISSPCSAHPGGQPQVQGTQSPRDFPQESSLSDSDITASVPLLLPLKTSFSLDTSRCFSTTTSAPNVHSPHELRDHRNVSLTSPAPHQVGPSFPPLLPRLSPTCCQGHQESGPVLLCSPVTLPHDKPAQLTKLWPHWPSQAWRWPSSAVIKALPAVPPSSHESLRPQVSMGIEP